jgi:hypothetical protein
LNSSSPAQNASLHTYPSAFNGGASSTAQRILALS